MNLPGLQYLERALFAGDQGLVATSSSGGSKA